MTTILLFVALVVVALVVFAVIRSVLVKLVTAFFVILAIVIIFAVSGDSIKGSVSPLQLGDDSLIIYVDKEVVEVPYNQVYRIDIQETAEGKISVNVATLNANYKVIIGSIQYEWSLKNNIFKKVPGRVYSSVN